MLSLEQCAGASGDILDGYRAVFDCLDNFPGFVLCAVETTDKNCSVLHDLIVGFAPRGFEGIHQINVLSGTQVFAKIMDTAAIVAVLRISSCC